MMDDEFTSASERLSRKLVPFLKSKALPKLTSAVRLHPVTIMLGVIAVVSVIATFISVVPQVLEDVGRSREMASQGTPFRPVWLATPAAGFLVLARSLTFFGIAAIFEYLVRIHREFQLLTADEVTGLRPSRRPRSARAPQDDEQG